MEHGALGQTADFVRTRLKDREKKKLKYVKVLLAKKGGGGERASLACMYLYT